MVNTLQQNPSLLMTGTQPPSFDYDTLFADTIQAIRRGLSQFLETTSETTPMKGDADEAANRLWEAMRYSAMNTGKLIRPLLLIETCLACGGKLESALPTACAVEMVHSQSLIHDDLPCMDNDDLRRGKPSLHKAFDEATAILAGDALLAMAFGVISRSTPLSENLTPKKILGIIGDFSAVSSVAGLVNGQYVDIHYENKPFDESVLQYIHTYKTGALFRFSARAGAILSGASDATVETMSCFGEKLGLAFQIVDDILDIQSDSQTLGKTAGKDTAAHKATYPALFGLEISRQKADQLIDDAHECLASLPKAQQEKLHWLTLFMRQRIH